jgi:hypothetical protein
VFFVAQLAFEISLEKSLQISLRKIGFPVSIQVLETGWRKHGAG